MRRLLGISLILALIGFAPMHQVLASVSEPSGNPTLLKRLEKASDNTLKVEWNRTIGTPSLLTGSLSRPSKHSAEWITFEFLFKWRTLYGLQNANRDFKVVNIERNNGDTLVSLRHLLFRTPVWEDRLVVTINSQGVIHRVEGTIHPRLEKKSAYRPMYPAITKQQAIDKAIATVRGELAIDPTVEPYYLAERAGTPLVYVVSLEYRQPERSITTLIHSVTGRIIDQWENELVKPRTAMHSYSVTPGI